MSLSEREYRIVAVCDGVKHTIDTLGCWGPRQDYLPTPEARLERAKQRLEECARFHRVMGSLHDYEVTKMWIEERPVGAWRKTGIGIEGNDA